MKRALVTGWAGFIGSHLAEALVAQGVQVIGVDCAEPRFGEIASLTDSGLFRSVTLDLSVDPLAKIVAGCDVVFHLAGRAGGRTSWSGDFEDQVAANVLGTRRLVECCWQQRMPRLVLASSSSVYGETIGPSNEDDDCRPMSPYGVTKLAAEQLALAYARRTDNPLSVVALRYFTTFGPRQRPDMLLGRILFSALSGAPVTLYGDGTQRREFTYVSDVVDATLAAAQLECREEVINVSGGTSVSLMEAVSTVSRVLGEPIPVEAAEARPGDVAATRADLQTAFELLGYVPKIGLAEGLSRQADWLRGMDSAHLRAYASEVASRGVVYERRVADFGVTR